jgi:predicted DNA-binding transcriptional regulator YafY
MTRVGQRSATETVAAIMQAFLSQRTWKQASLAEHLGLHVPALRKRLVELQDSGMPLSRDEEHPHVYWSVPRNWFPGGVLVPAEDVEPLLRLFARLPRGKDRDRLLAIAVRAISGPGKDAAGDVSGIVPPAAPPDEKLLATVEDAARQKQALHFRYYSASRGALSLRHASVHRVLLGAPARFLATCHKAGDLRWFRLDSVQTAVIDSNEAFRPADDEAIEERVRGTLDGYYDGAAKAERHAFLVREPEARWVAKNLLEGMTEESTKDGLRVTIETTALVRLARYVVGLGAAARAENESLRNAVAELASGALATHPRPG